MSFNIGKKKFELDTPCLVIDIDKLKRNLALMQEHSKKNKVNLRPHVKTHKCSQLAKMQVEQGSIGISAAKVSEAKVLADNNVPGILITSPVVTVNKIKILIEIVKLRKDLMLVVDNLKNADDLNKAAIDANLNINVLIDIDPGIARTGVKFENILTFAKDLKKYSNLKICGIQCYAGNLQHIENYNERLDASLSIMNKAGKVAQELRANGINCDIVTGTGTGTFDIDIQESEVTEIQPGSYTVMDVEYGVIGSKENEKQFNKFENAMTLLTSVISVNDKRHVTVDAGWKALYLNDLKPRIISHYNLNYDWGGFGDEHGKITCNSKDDILPGLCEVLEVVVPHCDPTINLFDKFYIVKNDKVIDEWIIDMRGKSQ